MSVIYIGAYSFSVSNDASSSSKCEATNVSGVSVQVSNSGCSNCSAVSSSNGQSYGANSYGGAMSVIYIGAYSFSTNNNGSSSSMCESTNVSGVSVQVSNSDCSNCSAVSRSMKVSHGANSYGGAMSVLYIGAYSYSASNGGFFQVSNSSVGFTHVHLLHIAITNSGFEHCSALSGECCTTVEAKELTPVEFSEAGAGSLGANVSLSSLPVFVCDTAMWRLVMLCRFTAARSASR
jgi:hypothetical protein